MRGGHPFASVVEGTPLVVALRPNAWTMHVGIDTDPEAIADPHRITELFAAYLEELEAISARRGSMGAVAGSPSVAARPGHSS